MYSVFVEGDECLMWRNFVEDILAVFLTTGALLLSAGLVLTVLQSASELLMVSLLGSGALLMILGCSDRLKNLGESDE